MKTKPSRESHTHPEEKPGRVCLANAGQEMKIVANLKDKMTENEKCQCLIKAISNLGNVLILKFIVLNRISFSLNLNKTQHTSRNLAEKD